ncbi:uncharacterized protein [Amphiura filiformis]|uniref:uncharacterized protein n=1 Tax=Amphiura filiformis TaxID=82378 RepID=UPI003B213E68
MVYWLGVCGGLLGDVQETTLYNLFKMTDSLIQPSFEEQYIPALCDQTSTALSLLERDFPVYVQNITTHIIHHIPRDIPEFGPLHGRWTFPYERVQCWLSRQVTNKQHQEATIMETYAIYDWCVFLMLSGKVTALKEICRDDLKNRQGISNLIVHMLEQNNLNATTKTERVNSRRQHLLSQQYIQQMVKFYQIFSHDYEISISDIDPIAVKMQRFTKTTDDHKHILYRTKDAEMTTERVASYVRVSVDNGLQAESRFGRIQNLFDHKFGEETFTWAVIKIYLDTKLEKGTFFNTSMSHTDSDHLYPVSLLSPPLIVAEENSRLWFLNAKSQSNYWDAKMNTQLQYGL